MNFQNLRIGTKLWLAVGLFIGAFVALIAFAAIYDLRLQVRSDEARSSTDAKIRLATQWSQYTEAAVNRAQANAINADPAVTKLLGDANTAAIARITELQKQLGAMPQSEAEKALTAKIAADRKAVLESSAKVTKLKEAGDIAAARTESATTFTAATLPYLKGLSDFVKLQEGAAAEARAQIAAERRTMAFMVLGILGAIIAGLAASTVLLIRSIRTPLLEAVAMAGRIAAGDLGNRQQATRGDELGDLTRALQKMNDSLAGTVGQVRSAADSIQTASAEIATGNNDLSRRTEDTASNLQKTASAIEQLTGTVRQSADSAQTANQLAGSAAQVAQRGGEVVSQVVTTMSEINTASKRIADIIGTIDGIAFQTNILALNAAVEAARAGEQGRGFAVVAGEVRSLAQRSAEAAREIKSLIGSSVEKVESGSRLVADAGSTMTEIVSSVQRVSDIIGEISAAAAEQSQGIGQVNGSINQLDQMTQQNAALVEESAAAAESLKEQAVRLAGVMSSFRLGDAAPAAAPKPAPAPAAKPAPAPAQAAARQTIQRASEQSRSAKPAAQSAPAPKPAAPKPAASPAADSGEWETF